MLIGHQKQWEFLKKTFDSGKLPHSLLFQGQEQIGKKTLALEFAKYLNCEKKDGKPCHECRSCQDIQNNRYPDLILIEPRDKEIQISQIRDLSWQLSLKPYFSNLKIAIIDNAHLMNQEAQNCFLKTLEEPKGNSLLILITEYPELLFSTILSRVQKIKFFPVRPEEIEIYLKKQGCSLEKIKEISRFSFGRPGRVNDFLEDPPKLENYKEKIKEILKISNSNLGFRLQYAKNLAEDPVAVKNTLEVWLRFFRGALLNSIASNPASVKGFNNYSTQKIKKIIENLQKISYWISNTNTNTRLALEILMLDF